MSTKRGGLASKSVKGKTDWVKLKALPDASIKFTADAPRTVPEDWAEAVAHRGLPLPAGNERIALPVDADVDGRFRTR